MKQLGAGEEKRNVRARFKHQIHASPQHMISSDLWKLLCKMGVEIYKIGPEVNWCPQTHYMLY